MRILCIIPVRGGSKGLPKKNSLEIKNGISLLEWTINQAHKTYPNEDVIVSTEDINLSNIARLSGARVLNRPSYLAQDNSSTSDVVLDVLKQLEPYSYVYEAIAILQVTSALREDNDINQSIEMIKTNLYDSIISVYETKDSHPAKQYYLEKINGIDVASSFVPSLQHANRQERPNVYQRNGAIFTVTKNYFFKTNKLWGGRIGVVKMPYERSIDIDTAEDLEKARLFIN